MEFASRERKCASLYPGWRAQGQQGQIVSWGEHQGPRPKDHGSCARVI